MRINMQLRALRAGSKVQTLRWFKRVQRFENETLRYENEDKNDRC